MSITKPDALRYLIERSTIDPMTRCWNWTSSLTRDGYGQVTTCDLMRTYGIKGAHRLAKALFEDWTPSGPYEQIRHQCHNRRCINPAHLLTGTALDNAADRKIAGHKISGRKMGRAITISNAVVDALREAAAGGARVADLSATYGVSLSYTYSLIRGTRRAEVI